MIDFKNLSDYRENNRIEAKKALGGFPQSVWETYSAFANTLGGIILLGVEEYKDHTLHAVNLPDPDKLVKELWQGLNDPAKISTNILANKHVSIENIGGNRIIVITVPRAHRYDRPVYIGGNPLSGSYRRCGEGDYRCTREEIEAMLRDAAEKTPDMRVIENSGTDALDYGSVRRYRALMKTYRPDHAWQKLDDDGFLQKLGALSCEENVLHPTAAGLLMFGKAESIVKEFPDYSLIYREETDGNGRTYCNWSGNILDFYLFVHEKIVQNTVVPLSAASSGKIDAAPVYRALKEALANCVINADYYGEKSIEIVKGRDMITFSNAGSFRIDAKKARAGGVSDPRNGALIKMFNLIDVGAGIGSGLPHIFAVWERQGWLTPYISEEFDPERITLSLAIGKGRSVNTASGAETPAQRAAIIEYLTDRTSGSISDFCRLLNVKAARVNELLAQLIAADVVVAENGGDSLTYRLKR